MDVLWDWDRQGHAKAHATSGTLPQVRVSLFGVKAWGRYINYANELVNIGREPTGYLQWLVDAGSAIDQECIAKIDQTQRLLFTDVFSKCGGVSADLAVERGNQVPEAASLEETRVVKLAAQAQAAERECQLVSLRAAASREETRVAKLEAQAAVTKMHADKEMVALARQETQAVADQVRTTAAALHKREVVVVATEISQTKVREAAITREARLSAREVRLSARESQLSLREKALVDLDSETTTSDCNADRTEFRVNLGGRPIDGVYDGKRLSKTIWRLDGPGDCRLALFAIPRSHEQVSSWNTPLYLSLPCPKDKHPSEIDPNSGKMTCARYENVGNQNVVIFTIAH